MNKLLHTMKDKGVPFSFLAGDKLVDQKLVNGVYERADTDMGDYWMSFMEMSNIFLQNVDACHVGNFDEYLLSTRAMLPGMLACNNHDYGKWLPDYWTMISSLPYEKKKAF